MNANPTDRGRRIDPLSTAVGDLLQLLGRLAMSPVFLLSGIAKVEDPVRFKACMVSAGIPLPVVALVVAILIETIGGALIAIGYKTREVAGMLVVFTLLNGAVFHGDFANPAQSMQFWKDVAMAGGLLQLAALGAGRWSVDFS